MNNAILMSIHPIWCELIAEGKKTIEVRKTRPKIDTPFKCYIYETKGKTAYPTFIDEEGHEIYEGRGQIIGEFTCKEITTYKADDLRPPVPDSHYGYLERQWYIDEEDLRKTCLTYEEFKCYGWPVYGWGFGNRTKLYGWHIDDLIIYDKPKELSEFGLTKSPQSWYYIKEIDK